MKTTIVVMLTICAGAYLLAGARSSQATSDPTTPADATPAGSAGRSFVVPGRTQCISTRKGIVAPTVLHPVVEVLVTLGARVKKDQPLVKLDDDEPQADVRAKKALLENAELAAREAKRLLSSLEAIHARGALPENRLHEARAAAQKADKEALAAKAVLDAAAAELEHYTVAASIDGIVSRWEVYRGMVSRPGTTVWGEILNLDEIDVCCQLALGQLDCLKVGQTAEVLSADSTKLYGTAKVEFIGLEADRDSGKVPVLVRLANPEGALRCQVPVQVRFFASGTVALK
jgi:multidrug efflux system membrane fusion protein